MFDARTNGTPDVKIELIVDAYQYYKCNSIHLSGITIQDGKTSYDSVHYHNDDGKFIYKYCRGNQTRSEIILNRMTNNYILVTVDRSELQ